jgi:hypothetical protein
MANVSSKPTLCPSPFETRSRIRFVPPLRHVPRSALSGTLGNHLWRRVNLDLPPWHAAGISLRQIELRPQPVNCRDAAPEVAREVRSTQFLPGVQPSKLSLANLQFRQTHHASSASGMITPV